MKLTSVWRSFAAKLKQHLQMTVVVVLLLVLLIYLLGGFRTDFQPLPDMADYPTVMERKTAFFTYLRPIVEFHNNKILENRKQLFSIADQLNAKGKISWWDELWLKQLADEYDVNWNTEAISDSITTLKRRVDMIPTSLALIQAAKESGWGRSRFAMHGNGLFGQWCYDPGCGIVPKNRLPGAQHEVQTFNTVSDSVASYLKNLNTDERYRPLRMIRQQLRESGKEPDGLSLADGLLFYSERRQAYVEEVKKMLRRYQAQQQAAMVTDEKVL